MTVPTPLGGDEASHSLSFLLSGVKKEAVILVGRGLFFLLLLTIFPDFTLAGAKSPDMIAGPALHVKTDGLWLHLIAKGLEAPVVEWKFAGRTAPLVPLRKIRKDSWVSPALPLTPRPTAYRISDGSWASPLYRISQSGSSDGSFSFVVYGDHRSGSGDELVHRHFVEKIIDAKPHLVIHTGDLVVNAQRERHWRHFFREAGPLVSQIPFMPSKGNHDESKTDRYEYFFPINGKKSFYTFDYGGVTFIALDSQINFRRGSSQYRFLEKTLRAKRSEDPIIVTFHLPALSFAAHGSDRMVRRHLVPLFSRYGVDVVFSGHDHGYQRSKKVDGVTYVVAAGGGAPLYRVTADPRLETYRVVYNVVFVTIDRGRRLRAKVVNVQGGVEDRFEIEL